MDYSMINNLTRPEEVYALRAARLVCPERPQEVLSAYLFDTCDECARHTSGHCYACQCIEQAIMAAPRGMRQW
jgi:hypothetical protein